MITRRKPLKRSPIRRKPKQDGVKVRGGREICEGAAWQARREEVHDRAGGLCERCGRPAPLHNELDLDYGEVRVPAGHVHHKNGTRGMGGGKRDDRLENLEWLDWRCHATLHQPEKAIPAKHQT